MNSSLDAKYPLHRHAKVVALNAFVPRGAWVTDEDFGGEIDIANGWEVGWWAEALGCSRQRLCEAVRRVGPDAAAVHRELKREEHARFLKSLAAMMRESAAD